MKRLLAALLLVAVLFVQPANAQVSYSTNFDTLTVGGLTGQDGWVVGSGTSNMPAVSTLFSQSPSQSLRLIGFPGSGSTFMSNGHAFAAGAPSTNTMLLQASASIFVTSIAGADRYFGIGFGTNSLATTGFMGIALGGNGLRGGGGSYSSFNSLATGQLQNRTTADFLNRWIQMSVTADRSITTNNVVFTFSGLNTSGGNAIETFTRSVNFGTTNLSFIQVFSDWGSTSSFNGEAFLDDVSFSAGPLVSVPEPHQIMLIAGGALGAGVTALRYWRRKPKRFARV